MAKLFDKHTIATETTLQAALNNAAARTTRILHANAETTWVPQPFQTDLYPLDAGILATYLTNVAHKTPTVDLARSASPATHLDQQLKDLASAAGILTENWYPALYLPHSQFSKPHYPHTTQPARISALYHNRFGIKRPFDAIFNTIHFINAIATNQPRAGGLTVKNGIYLDELTRCLNTYLDNLAAIDTPLI